MPGVRPVHEPPRSVASGRVSGAKARWRRTVGTAALAAAGASALLTSCAHPKAPDADPPRMPPASFAPALRQGLSAAVGVFGVGLEYSAAELQKSEARRRVGAGRVADRIGAGFVISGAEGLIVTASHAVAGSQRIAVRLPDRRIVAATLVGEDEMADIALLRVPLVLPEPPPQGRSAALRPGDWVLAVGEPYGLNRSVVAGIVGGTDRHFAEDQELLFIQSDLALNPGNSGGPLLDGSGAIVGMNTRTVVGSEGSGGVSLSIPIEIVMQIVGELRDQGHVARPRLGAEFDDVAPFVALDARRAYASGARVGEVGLDSLAERIGLQVGDIIVGMNGRPIGHSGDLARALLAWRSVSGTTLTVFREQAYLELRLQ